MSRYYCWVATGGEKGERGEGQGRGVGLESGSRQMAGEEVEEKDTESRVRRKGMETRGRETRKGRRKKEKKKKVKEEEGGRDGGWGGGRLAVVSMITILSDPCRCGEAQG